MQISTEQIDAIKRNVSQPRTESSQAQAGNVAELAAAYGVKMDEVRRFTEMAMAADEDPLRARRLRELARKVQEGSYQVDAETLVDMAERRAIADRAADL